jgi:hypothetical protein
MIKRCEYSQIRPNILLRNVTFRVEIREYCLLQERGTGTKINWVARNLGWQRVDMLQLLW